MLYVATHQSFHSTMEPVVDLGQIKGMTRKSKVQTALKKVTMLKNKARIFQPWRYVYGHWPGTSMTWYVNKSSEGATATPCAKRARQCCQRHFWRFTCDPLDKHPSVHWGKAHWFFANTYRSLPHVYEQPSWMPFPDNSSVEFNSDSITIEEIQAVIKWSKPTSTPSLFNQIPYQVFRKYPTLTLISPSQYLSVMLVNFNSCKHMEIT